MNDADSSEEAAVGADPGLEAEVERQLALVTRGAALIITPDLLRKKLRRSLRTGHPLRVKLGVDPTAHDLHLGFTLHLERLRIFADLGHLPVLIIGDATAMLGDPSGRNKARPQLTREQVDDYAKSYLDQASIILDVDRVEVHRNGDWLRDLGFTGFITLAGRATVAQMLAREDFAKRFAESAPIHLHELIYPLMQGWDSVVVRSDVELGGQDQLFNLLVGRDLQEAEGQEGQACVMSPMLVGTDGTMKMSKSFGNTIGITEPPDEMFGKVMSLPDEAMPSWFELATRLPVAAIEALREEGMHPREMKDRLARAVVERFYGEAAAAAASERFRQVFTRGELPEEMPRLGVPAHALADGRIGIAALVKLVGFAASGSEARRLVQQGGVRFAEQAISDPTATVAVSGGEVLQVGKKRFGRVAVE